MTHPHRLFYGDAPGVKEGSGCPVRVSVDLIPSMLETFRVMNSMAFWGESAVKSTTASWAPKVAQAPWTSMPDVGRFSSFFSSFVTLLMRGASALMRQTYPCFGKVFFLLRSPRGFFRWRTAPEASLSAFNTFPYDSGRIVKTKLSSSSGCQPSRWSCYPTRLPQGSTRVPPFLPWCLTL